jgi:hypothetical protein
MNTLIEDYSKARTKRFVFSVWSIHRGRRTGNTNQKRARTNSADGSIVLRGMRIFCFPRKIGLDGFCTIEGNRGRSKTMKIVIIAGGIDTRISEELYIYR